MDFMSQSWVVQYLILINVISGIVFAVDKLMATRRRHRVPEKTLHLLEMLGGVFVIWMLMYFLRHKNKKSGYRNITWFLFILWIGFMVLLAR